MKLEILAYEKATPLDSFVICSCVGKWTADVPNVTECTKRTEIVRQCKVGVPRGGDFIPVRLKPGLQRSSLIGSRITSH
jgi:hypothetical protein